MKSFKINKLKRLIVGIVAFTMIFTVIPVVNVQNVYADNTITTTIKRVHVNPQGDTLYSVYMNSSQTYTSPEYINISGYQYIEVELYGEYMHGSYNSGTITEAYVYKYGGGDIPWATKSGTGISGTETNSDSSTKMDCVTNKQSKTITYTFDTARLGVTQIKFSATGVSYGTVGCSNIALVTVRGIKPVNPAFVAFLGDSDLTWVNRQTIFRRLKPFLHLKISSLFRPF